MRGRRRVLFILVSGAIAVGAISASSVVAAPLSPSLSNVPSANTKSDGYAPASKLSPELRQIAVAQGATALENPSALTSYYGYDNDVLNVAGQPQMLPTPTSPTAEAHKTEPDKNTYLVFKNGLERRRRRLRLRHALPLPGPRGRRRRRRLHHPDQPRRRRRAPGHAAGRPRTPTASRLPTIDGSTWDPWAKRLLFTTENARRADLRGDAGLPVDGRRRLRRARPGRLRGHPERLRRQHLDRRGRRRLEQAGHRRAKRPNSFVYRYVPAPSRATCQRGKLQVAAGAATPTANRSPSPARQRSTAPTRSRSTPTATSFKTRWVTIHDTAVDGDRAVRRQRTRQGRRTRRRSSDPRTAPFRPGSDFTKFFFDETGDTNATSVENDTARRLGLDLRAHPERPERQHRHAALFYKGDEAHSGLDNVDLPLAQPRSPSSRTRATRCTPSATRSTPASSGTSTPDYSNPANQPVRWLAEGRDASATLDSANGGFGTNDGDNEITGVHVSDGDPRPERHPRRRRSRTSNSDGWRWFYTQQHGDNHTYEVLLRHDGF